MIHPHEEGFVQSFIVKNKRERVAMLLVSPKRREEFRKSLAHFRDLDPRYAHLVSSKTAHTVEEWLRLLRSKGAPERCWVISESHARDGREALLADALKEGWGAGMGTILSCIPGKLAYFEDEDGQRLLER
jgi:hypothetical protein